MIDKPRIRTVVILGAAALASAAFVVVGHLVQTATVLRLDIRAELALHRALDSPLGDAWAMTASFIGSNLVLLPTVAAVALLAVHRRQRAAAIVLVVDALATIIVGYLLKLVYTRPRPTLFAKVETLSDYSFPSGHSMSAVGAWGVIAAVLVVLYPDRRRLIIAVTIPLVASIGLSRIYLGVHWPSDVVGGFLGGAVTLLASIQLLRRRTGSRS